MSNFNDCCECQLMIDLLLNWKVDEQIHAPVLTRTKPHSDLFRNIHLYKICFSAAKSVRLAGQHRSGNLADIHSPL